MTEGQDDFYSSGNVPVEKKGQHLESMLLRLPDLAPQHALEVGKEFGAQFCQLLNGKWRLAPQWDGATLYFSLSVEQIRLRNFDNIHFLFVLGLNGDESYIDRVLRERASNSRLLVAFIFLADLKSGVELRASKLPMCVTLGSEDFRKVSGSTTAPARALAERVRASLPLGALNPFETTTSVRANMFVGRNSEVSKLFNADRNFGIPGPSRIGKTSLMQRYRQELLTKDPERYNRCFYVDFYNCPNRSEDEISQFLAWHMVENSKTWAMTYAKLDAYLRELRSERGGTLELLLDEVDRVCESHTFRLLTEFAKTEEFRAQHQDFRPAVRLIMCGKYSLYNFMLHGVNEPQKNRVERLTLKPFDQATIEELFCGPFEHLGIMIQQKDELIQVLQEQTGGMPHVIQYYGNKAVELALERGTNSISKSMLFDISRQVETRDFLMSPIEDLGDDAAEWLALAMAFSERQSFDQNSLTALRKSERMPIQDSHLRELCKKLYICNLITISQDASGSAAYAMTSKLIGDLIRKDLFLKSRLEELRASYRGPA